MKGLTRTEQLVLAILVLLFVAGLTVKVWRQSDVTPTVKTVFQYSNAGTEL